MARQATGSIHEKVTGSGTVPLNTGRTSFMLTSQAARAMALVRVRDDPKLETVTNNKAERAGKVFIDWTRNVAHQTTARA